MSQKTIKLELDIPVDSIEADQIADDLRTMTGKGNGPLPESLLSCLKQNYTIFEVRDTVSVRTGNFTIVSGMLNNFGKEEGSKESTEKI
jgi:hypothetical protein